MANEKSHIHSSLPPRTLIRQDRGPAKLRKPSMTTAKTLFEPPSGYKSAGVVIVENYMLLEDTVPEAVHQKADAGGDVIIHLRSETIVKDGRLSGDRIEAEFFVREFLCC